MVSLIEMQSRGSEPLLLLQPRPLARESGSILLLPLLPERPKAVSLPWELWSHILRFVVLDDAVNLAALDVPSRRVHVRKRASLLRVCKDWLEAVKPLVYSDVHIFTVPALEQFVLRLDESEKKWDSIRRIPYSTPGRWVHSFDISSILHIDHTEDSAVDRLLTKLFPLLPFLRSLYLCADLTLSSAALASLSTKVSIDPIMTLKGYAVSSQPALEFLARLESLECLELINGEGPRVWLTTYDPAMPTDPQDPMFFPSAPALHFPRLTELSVFAPFPTPVIAALLRAPLPALRHLVITPSDDAPHGAARALLTTHGVNLHTLRINQPCTWHALGSREPFPVTALRTSPHLRRLALDYPLAPLAAPPPEGHPLQELTIPRFNTKFLKALEGLLPRLPQLSVVRLRNERCLTSKGYRKALEAGVQGEMREWKVRLARKHVRLVDKNWQEPS